MNLFQRQAPLPKSAKHDATALGSEINGEVVGMGRHCSRLKGFGLKGFNLLDQRINKGSGGDKGLVVLGFCCVLR